MKFEELTLEQLEQASEMLKAIAHPIRFAILIKLDSGKKLSVSEIHNALQIEQSTASHHLGILKDKGIVLSKRDGKNIYYSLKYEKLSDIVGCISQCVCS